MPILYSAIARSSLILSKFASCSGNFTETVQQILPKIPLDDKKFTYSIGNFMFHYIMENTLVYFCITDDKFPSKRAFSFLDEVKQKFLASFEGTPAIAVPYAAMNQLDNSAFDQVLQTETTRYNENKPSLPKMKAELDDLKSIMAKNVDKIAMRGERLESLMDRTDGLATHTTVYQEYCSASSTQVLVAEHEIKNHISSSFSGSGVFSWCGGLRWTEMAKLCVISELIYYLTMFSCSHYTNILIAIAKTEKPLCIISQLGGDVIEYKYMTIEDLFNVYALFQLNKQLKV